MTLVLQMKMLKLREVMQLADVGGKKESRQPASTPCPSLECGFLGKRLAF